jgi:DNA-binding CsgD family transcriptional regulator
MSNKSLAEIIDNSLNEIIPIAEKLPGVVIIHDLRDWSVLYMCGKGLKELNISLEEVTKLSMQEYHARFFNEEDFKDYAPKIFTLMENNNTNDAITFFQQVRVSDDKDWTWHMSSMKILAHDTEGKPLLSITMAFPIDSMHRMTAKASRLLKENNFLRKNFHIYSKLGKRELEVLRLLALGKSANEISETLYLSIHTIETHRKNIRQKLGANSHYDLSEYARAFDLI